MLGTAIHQGNSCNVKWQGAQRSPGQAVISSRGIGSMDRKSKGRGKRGPEWEAQCKQSQLLIIPAHVRNWTYFDVVPQRPLRPPIPRSQTAAPRASGEGAAKILASERNGDSVRERKREMRRTFLYL